MDKIDLMFKEAYEYLKPYWNPKDGDIIYFEYTEKDKDFWKMKYEEAGKEYEPKDGWWYVDNNIEFKNNGTDRYSNHLKKEAKAWKARQEDLQEIFRNKTGNPDPLGIMILATEWFKRRKYHDNKSIWNDMGAMWLCFVMETCYNKTWDGKSWAPLEDR